MTATNKSARRQAPKIAMEVGSYQAWFSPITVHDTQLEFVLDKADERNGRPTRIQLQPQGRTFTSYSEKLGEMLNREFRRTQRTKDVRIVERQEYGNISFCIEAPSLDLLQTCLRRCAMVCQLWVNKYRINDMARG